MITSHKVNTTHLAYNVHKSGRKTSSNGKHAYFVSQMLFVVEYA